MDNSKDSPATGRAVDFNRVNLALAKRQSMLASLMGISSANKPERSMSFQEGSDKEDDFTAEPELLGIGATAPEEDDGDKQKALSNDRLKRTLLPKGFTKRPKGNPQDKSAAPKSPHGKSNVMRPSRDDEVESDEDAGRSSLGKRKRKQPDQGEENAVVSEAAGEGSNEKAVTPYAHESETDMDSVEARMKQRQKRGSKRKKRKERKSMASW